MESEVYGQQDLGLIDASVLWIGSKIMPWWTLGCDTLAEAFWEMGVGCPQSGFGNRTSCGGILGNEPSRKDTRFECPDGAGLEDPKLTGQSEASRVIDHHCYGLITDSEA